MSEIEEENFLIECENSPKISEFSSANFKPSYSHGIEIGLQTERSEAKLNE